MANRFPDEEDDFPPPLKDPEEIARAKAAYESTFAMRRKALRWAYLVLAILLILVIYLALR